MARFFFDIHDGMDHPDREGTDLNDLAAARVEAARYASELLIEMPETFWNGEIWMLTVSDALRKAIFSLTIRETDAASTEPFAIA